jgi:hypothetical protein
MMDRYRSTHERLRNAYKIVVGEPEGRDYSEDLDVDGEIILEGIVRKWN